MFPLLCSYIVGVPLKISERESERERGDRERKRGGGGSEAKRRGIDKQTNTDYSGGGGGGGGCHCARQARHNIAHTFDTNISITFQWHWNKLNSLPMVYANVRAKEVEPKRVYELHAWLHRPLLVEWVPVLELNLYPARLFFLEFWKKTLIPLFLSNIPSLFYLSANMIKLLIEHSSRLNLSYSFISLFASMNTGIARFIHI